MDENRPTQALYRGDVYQSRYFDVSLLEWDDAEGFGICTIDHTATAMGANPDVEFTAEEYLFDLGVHVIDGARELDGYIVVPLSTDIVAALSRLDNDFENCAHEIDAENLVAKIYG